MLRRSFLSGLAAALVASKASGKGVGQMLMPKPKGTIYSNRVIRKYMDIEAIQDRNILLTTDWKYIVRVVNIPITILKD